MLGSWKILWKFKVMVSLIDLMLNNSLIFEFFRYMGSPDIVLSAMF